MRHRLLLLPVALLGACNPRGGPAGPEPCSVRTNELTQALYEPARAIHFLLDDDAGDRECIPGAGAECGALLDEQCSVQLTAAVGNAVELDIDMFNPSYGDSVDITSVALTGDPSFVVLTAPPAIEPQGTATIRIRFAPSSAAQLSARLVVTSNAINNNEGGTVELALKGTAEL